MNFEKTQHLSVESTEKDLSDKEIFNDTQEASLEEIENNNKIRELIRILKPQNINLEEYEDQIVEELLDDVKRVQISKGKLIESPEETTKEALEILESKIKAIVEDSRKENNKVDKALVRRARIALLKTGDFSDIKEYIPNLEDLSLNKFSSYLHWWANESDRKLTEEEIDSLISLNLGINFFDESYFYFENCVEKAPESLLLQATSSTHSGQYYNLKHVFKNAYSDTPYSEKCFNHLLSKNQFGSLLVENFDKFENAYFKDAVIGYNPDSPYNAKDMAHSLKHMNLHEEVLNKRLDIIIRNQQLTNSDLQDEMIRSRYGELIEKFDSLKDGWNSSTNDWRPILKEEEKISVARDIIESGYIGILHEKKSLIKEIAEKDYEWLLDIVKSFGQEYLLLTGGHLKEPDQLDYAKKLISSGKEHVLSSLVDLKEMNQIFSENVLDQEIYNVLAKTKDNPPPITLFKDLDETLLKDFNFKNSSKEILSFNIENTSEFPEHKNYQDLVKFSNSLFGHDNAGLLLGSLGINLENLKDFNLEEIKESIQEKFEIIEPWLSEIFGTESLERKKTSFLVDYGVLLKEEAVDLKDILSQIKYLPKDYIGNEEMYLEGLRILRNLDDAGKNDFFNKMTEINNVFPNTELQKRYFTMCGGEPVSVDLRSCIGNIPEYSEKYKEMDEDQKKFWNELFPWSEFLEKIDGFQKQSRRTEYDPWRNQFLPLLHGRTGISLSSVEDGKMVQDYFERFGMRNMPYIFTLFSEVYRAKNVEFLDGHIMETLRNSFDIDAWELCKNDKTNTKLILSELEKVYPKMRKSIRLEDNSFASKAIESPYALDLLKSIIGDSGHSHGVNIEESLKIYRESLSKNPEKFKLPKGYEEVEISVPEMVIVEGDRESKIYEEKEKILSNPELRQTVNLYNQILNEVEEGDSLEWFDNKVNEIFLHFSNAEDKISALISQENEKENPNEKAMLGLQQKLEKNQKMKNDFTERLPLLKERKTSIIQMLEGLFDIVPDDWEGKKKLLMNLSLRDMSGKISEGYDELILNRGDSYFEGNISKYHNFIAYHVKEHYLDKKHGSTSSIETENKNLIKILKKYWGTQDFEKSILALSEQKLKVLERGEISSKLKNITLVPSKGLQRIFSGDLGKACTSRLNHSLAVGAYEGIVSYSLVLDKETENEKFAGSFLVIETENDKNEKTLVLRANNPQQNLFNSVDSESLIRSIIDEVKELGKRRGVSNLVVPLSSGATSNRPEVHSYYKKYFSINPKVKLVNNAETNFNNYEIWNPESGNAVVKI